MEKLNYCPPQTIEIEIKTGGLICGSPNGSGEDRDPWE